MKLNYLALSAVAFAVLAAQCLSAQPPVDPALLPVDDVAGLPNVLLIGDSISMGYTIPVRNLLKGKANVHHPPENCRESGYGVTHLDVWLGSTHWDVIHFNFGLHDLKYLAPDGSYTTPDKGTQVASTEVYEQNLRKIVARLKQTGAKLIWSNTTPVPDASSGRVKGDEIRYNETAARVMAESGIPTDDLHAIIAANPELQRPNNVHFTEEGYRALANAVTASIEKALLP